MGGQPRRSCPAYLSGAPAAGTATDSRARCLGGSQPAGTQRALRGAAPGARRGQAAPAPPTGTHVPLEDAAGQDGAGPHHQVSADGEAASAVALDEHDVGGLRLQHHHPRPLVHLIIRRREPVTPARRTAGRVSSWNTWDSRTLPGDPHRILEVAGQPRCRFPVTCPPPAPPPAPAAAAPPPPPWPRHRRNRRAAPPPPLPPPGGRGRDSATGGAGSDRGSRGALGVPPPAGPEWRRAAAHSLPPGPGVPRPAEPRWAPERNRKRPAAGWERHGGSGVRGVPLEPLRPRRR